MRLYLIYLVGICVFTRDIAESEQNIPNSQDLKEPLRAVLVSERTGALTVQGMQKNKNLVLHLASEISEFRELVKRYHAAVVELEAAKQSNNKHTDAIEEKAKLALRVITDKLDQGPSIIQESVYSSSSLNHVLHLAKKHSCELIVRWCCMSLRAPYLYPTTMPLQCNCNYYRCFSGA
eukprot:gene2378-5325_t